LRKRGRCRQAFQIREFGPIVYGYSMTIGPDGKPQVREFGNVKASNGTKIGQYVGAKPQISAEREPLSDPNTIDRGQSST